MRWFLGSLMTLAAMAACDPPGPERAHVEVLFSMDANRRPMASAPAAQVALGEALFTERLGAAACVDCHPRDRRGQDGAVHRRDTPALADVARQTLFGRDGLAVTLKAMVRRELTQHHGLGDDAALQAALAVQPALPALFAQAHPGEAPTLTSASEALVAWLGTWRTRGRWDRYVEGDDLALHAAERAGLATFVEVGCAICHGGRNLGGGSAHKLGLVVPFVATDHGRQQVTGQAADRDVWRAPMLRHVAHTAPYLHDGSVARLDEVVRLMARHELGKELTGPQVDSIVTLLAAVGDVDVDGSTPRLSLAMEPARER